MNTLALIWKTKDLRTKILIVLARLIVTRILAHVPIPGIDASGFQNFFQSNQFFNLLDIFSGGGLTNFSIAMLGVGPYITASIIMQLLTMIVPSLKELQKESGEAGRQKINQYTRWLTIPLAILSGFGTIRLLQSQGGAAILGTFDPFQWFLTILAIVAGSLLVMWIGEIISEYGIGNGLSLIIFAGIVAQLPSSAQSLFQLYDPSKLPTILGFAAVALVVIAGVVLVSEAQRNIPVSYAKRVRGDKLAGGVNTHLPLRLNQAGVIPIIFAVSVMLFPALIAQFFVNAKTAVLATYANKVIELFNSQGWFYGATYFLMVIIFTFFYTSIVFNPEEVAENVQRNGGFVPGVRPGKPTASFLNYIVTRITLFGALFLGAIAILPNIVQAFTGITALAVGGTSILIVVSVVIETVKTLEVQIVSKNYDKYITS